MSRWPNLKLVKPQKLSTCRAKYTSKENIDKYFRELSNILTQNNLHDKPERIFNIDESGINSEHSSPKVVCDEDINPQSITSQRSSTTTIIVGRSTVGNYIARIIFFKENDGMASSWRVHRLAQTARCQNPDGQILIFSKTI